MKVQGQTIKAWDEWLANELVEDGTISDVLGDPNPEQRKAVYHYVIRGFRDALKQLERAALKAETPATRLTDDEWRVVERAIRKAFSLNWVFADGLLAKLAALKAESSAPSGTEKVVTLAEIQRRCGLNTMQAMRVRQMLDEDAAASSPRSEREDEKKKKS